MPWPDYSEKNLHRIEICLWIFGQRISIKTFRWRFKQLCRFKQFSVLHPVGLETRVTDSRSFLKRLAAEEHSVIGSFVRLFLPRSYCTSGPAYFSSRQWGYSWGLFLYFFISHYTELAYNVYSIVVYCSFLCKV